MSDKSNHRLSCASNLPLYLLSASIFMLGFIIYYSSQNENQFDIQHATDLMASSGNFNHAVFLDEHLLESRKIVVTTGVNSHLSKQIVASLLLLNDQDPQQPIDLYLRTDGGWLPDAFAVVDTMRAISAPVNVYALGETSSAGAIILIGGTGRRVAMTHSLIMIHYIMDEPIEISFDRHLLNNRMEVDYFQTNTKLPDEWFKKIGDEVYYLDSKQALAYGIIDEIIEKF